MAINPWQSGQTQPLALLLAQTSGGVPQLANATFSIRFHNVDVPTTTDIVGTGAFGGPDASGTVTYTWGSGDPYNMPGTYDIYVIAVFPTGSPVLKRIWGPLRWNVVGPTM